MFTTCDGKKILTQTLPAKVLTQEYMIKHDSRQTMNRSHADKLLHNLQGKKTLTLTLTPKTLTP